MLTTVYAILSEGRDEEQMLDLDEALGFEVPPDETTAPTPIALRPAWLLNDSEILTVA